MRDPQKENTLKELRSQAEYREEARTFLIIKPKKNHNPLELKRLKDALEDYYDKVEVA